VRVQVVKKLEHRIAGEDGRIGDVDDGVGTRHHRTEALAGHDVDTHGA
jgi:hypothetical protein